MQVCLKPAFGISVVGTDGPIIRQSIHDSAEHCHKMLDWLHDDFVPMSSTQDAASHAVKEPHVAVQLTLPASWAGVQPSGSNSRQLDARSLADRERVRLYSICSAIASIEVQPDLAARAAAELQALEVCLGTAVAALKTWLASGGPERSEAPPLNLYQLRSTAAPVKDFQRHLQQEMGWDQLSFVASKAAAMAQARSLFPRCWSMPPSHLHKLICPSDAAGRHRSRCPGVEHAAARLGSSCLRSHPYIGFSSPGA